MYGVIYKTTNNLNGEFYIGQTIKKGKRFEWYIGGGLHLIRAVKKYGKENFSKEIIVECESREDLDNMERYYISLLKPFYNIDLGGNSVGHLSEEHKRKISLALKGRIVTDEWRKNNSEAQKGKKLSKETIEKRTKTLQENKRKEKELGIKKARKPFPENYKKNLSIAQRKRREREKMEKNKCQSFTDGL